MHWAVLLDFSFWPVASFMRVFIKILIWGEKNWILFTYTRDPYMIILIEETVNILPSLNKFLKALKASEFQKSFKYSQSLSRDSSQVTKVSQVCFLKKMFLPWKGTRPKITTKSKSLKGKCLVQQRWSSARTPKNKNEKTLRTKRTELSELTDHVKHTIKSVNVLPHICSSDPHPFLYRPRKVFQSTDVVWESKACDIVVRKMWKLRRKGTELSSFWNSTEWIELWGFLILWFIPHPCS